MIPTDGMNGAEGMVGAEDTPKGAEVGPADVSTTSLTRVGSKSTWRGAKRRSLCLGPLCAKAHPSIANDAMNRMVS